MNKLWFHQPWGLERCRDAGWPGRSGSRGWDPFSASPAERGVEARIAAGARMGNAPWAGALTTA